MEEIAKLVKQYALVHGLSVGQVLAKIQNYLGGGTWEL